MLGLFERKRRMIRRLLIVEDEPLIAFDSEHSLQLAGFDVVATVDSGESALDWLSTDHVDAALLDVGIAGRLSGFDLARIAFARGLPVLLITGGEAGDARDHAWGLLTKPYLPHQLVAAIEVLDSVRQDLPPGDLPPGLTLFREARTA